MMPFYTSRHSLSHKSERITAPSKLLHAVTSALHQSFSIPMILALCACSNTDIVDTPHPGFANERVRFSATSTAAATTKARPGNPFNSTGNLQTYGKFYVTGYEGSTMVIDNAKVEWNGTTWEYPDEPYWPNAPMNFYAFSNWAPQPSVTSAGIDETQYRITSNGDNQRDMLVACVQGATKEVRTLLNFKHALTQIVFKAGNLAPQKIDVLITGIGIVNVANQADVIYPNAQGEIEWSNHTRGSSPWYVVQGITDDELDITTAFTVPDLSAWPNDYAKYPRVQNTTDPENNALILLPQDFEAWDPLSGVQANLESNQTSYIEVKVLIKKAGLQTTDPNAEQHIYVGRISQTTGKMQPGNIFIPVSSLPNEAGRWEAGKRINYILTFGDDNSGSGGGGYDKFGKPILVPIKFRAVVQDWVETDVPLLTATFEATSWGITHQFIDSYTNQLLNDIKAAPAPKLYNATIKLKGTLSAAIGTTTPPVNDAGKSNLATNVTFDALLGNAGTFQNAKFLPGSTLQYIFSDVINLGQSMKVHIQVPTGWMGQGITDTTVNATTYAPGTSIVMGEPTAHSFTGVLLTKVASSGYSYNCHPDYIENNLAAVALNENHTPTPSLFHNTITVNGALTTTQNPLFFSSQMLAQIKDIAFAHSTLSINLTAVEIAAGRTIQTVVPTGWSIVKTEDATITTYYPGDVVTLSAAAAGVIKTLHYTKL